MIFTVQHLNEYFPDILFGTKTRRTSRLYCVVVFGKSEWLLLHRNGFNVFIN